jgi:hypothetical protein
MFWTLFLSLGLVGTTVAQTAGGCVCISGTAVNIRDGRKSMYNAFIYD